MTSSGTLSRSTSRRSSEGSASVLIATVNNDLRSVPTSHRSSVGSSSHSTDHKTASPKTSPLASLSRHTSHSSSNVQAADRAASLSQQSLSQRSQRSASIHSQSHFSSASSISRHGVVAPVPTQLPASRPAGVSSLALPRGLELGQTINFSAPIVYTDNSPMRYGNANSSYEVLSSRELLFNPVLGSGRNSARNSVHSSVLSPKAAIVAAPTQSVVLTSAQLAAPQVVFPNYASPLTSPSSAVLRSPVVSAPVYSVNVPSVASAIPTRIVSPSSVPLPSMPVVASPLASSVHSPVSYVQSEALASPTYVMRGSVASGSSGISGKVSPMRARLPSATPVIARSGLESALYLPGTFPAVGVMRNPLGPADGEAPWTMRVASRSAGSVALHSRAVRSTRSHSSHSSRWHSQASRPRYGNNFQPELQTVNEETRTQTEEGVWMTPKQLSSSAKTSKRRNIKKRPSKKSKSMVCC